MKLLKRSLWVLLLLTPTMAQAEGMVTMIDFGSKGCIPCKMMEPVLEKVAQDYDGKAIIRFVDVRENRDAASQFRIHGIPTQVFFDAQGQEVARHIGFMSEADMIAQLTAMGAAAEAKGL